MAAAATRPGGRRGKRQRGGGRGAGASAGRGRARSAGAGKAQRGGGKDAARGREKHSGLGWYIAGGIAISAVFVLPLLWEVFRSLQPESTVSASPSGASFTHLTFANYRTLLSGQDDIIRNVVNSLIVGALTAVLTSLVSLLAGYGFALFRFRGSGLVFGLVLLAFMIPFQAVLTPLFLEMHFAAPAEQPDRPGAVLHHVQPAGRGLRDA